MVRRKTMHPSMHRNERGSFVYYTCDRLPVRHYHQVRRREPRRLREPQPRLQPGRRAGERAGKLPHSGGAARHGRGPHHHDKADPRHADLGRDRGRGRHGSASADGVGVGRDRDRPARNAAVRLLCGLRGDAVLRSCDPDRRRGARRLARHGGRHSAQNR